MFGASTHARKKKKKKSANPNSKLDNLVQRGYHRPINTISQMVDSLLIYCEQNWNYGAHSSTTIDIFFYYSYFLF